MEIGFYLNAGRRDQLAAWTAERGLDHLGVPHFVASGSLGYNGKRFRFLVLPRYGTDLQSVIDSTKAGAFSLRTACTMAIQVVRAYVTI